MYVQNADKEKGLGFTHLNTQTSQLELSVYTEILK